MDTLGITVISLSDATGTHATTLSRYRSESYPSGPPPATKRRLLEQAMGLPRGYLDGDVEVDLADLRQAIQAGTVPTPTAMRSRKLPAGAIPTDESGHGYIMPPGHRPGVLREGSGGTVWDEPTEAEEQFRTFLRNIERTTRAMIGDPDLFEPSDTRQIQLAACRAIMKSAEKSGRPLAPWFHEVYNEVVSGTFH